MSYHPNVSSSFSLKKQKAQIRSASSNSTSWIPPFISSAYGQLNALFHPVTPHDAGVSATDAYIVIPPGVRAHLKERFDGYFTTEQQTHATVALRMLGGILTEIAGATNQAAEYEIYSPTLIPDANPVWTASVPNGATYIAPFSFERDVYVTNLTPFNAGVQPQLLVTDFAAEQVPTIIDVFCSSTMSLVKQFTQLSTAMLPVARNQNGLVSDGALYFTVSGMKPGLA